MVTTSSALPQTTSSVGLALLEAREAFPIHDPRRLEAYKDVRGIWTIGIGHTAAAGLPHPCEGMKLTESSMQALFTVDIKQYEAAVRDAIKGSALANHEFDACVSLCYNIGTGGFRGSSVAALIRELRYAEAADHFLLWDNPKSLLGRRQSERAQFLKAYGA